MLFKVGLSRAAAFSGSCVLRRHGVPVMDLKTDGSKEFCHFMQIGFLGRFQYAGPSKNPCHLTFQV